MMRSLFSGVSGLKAHQTGMDVIGNNIANVNTTGFKSSRTTFADMFSQTLTAASSSNGTVGGTNPKQIGLGSVVASIDLLFTDGSTQSTGKNTDMALQGNGLFIVKQGKQTYYTRNGDFRFDEAGNFVNSEGLYVQGWTAKDGVVSTNDATGNIQLQAGTGMPAQITSKTTYTSNLNASAPKIISMSVLDGNGNTIKVTGADSTWSVGTSQEPSNIENEEVTFSGNVVIEGATGQYAMGKNYSVDGNRLASVKLTDGDVVTGIPSTVAALSDYAVGNTLPTAISSISGTAVTYTDGSQIANSSNTYTVTLSDGSTVTSPITGSYTSGSAVSSSVATLSNTGVTLANGDTFTGGSSSFTITLSNGDVLTNGAATYSYTVGSAITPTVASIAGNTVTLSDGSTIAATTPANYTVGQAVSATVGTIAYNTVPTVTSITAQNAQQIASQTKNAVTVTLSNGDTVNVPKTSTTQYTVDSAVAAAISSINTASGTAVTFKDGATISNSNSTYTITLNNGDTIKIGGTIASTYTKGSSISSTNSGVGIQSVKGATVTLDNGDTLTNNSGTTYKAALANGDTLTLSAASSANYVMGKFPNTVTVKSISGSQVQLSDGSVITSSNVSQYTVGQAVPTTVKSFTGLPTSSVSTITADDAPTITEISGAVLSDDGTYDEFDTKTSGAYIKPSAGLSTSGIVLKLENGSTVTVSSSDTGSYKASSKYTATSPKSISLTMSDGSTVTETTGSYNVGYSMPVATTMKVFDKLGNEHNITLYFTKVATGNGTSSNQGNTWRVSVNADGGNSTTIKESDASETTVKMDPVQLKFNPSGTVESGSQQQQTLTLQNGAESPMAITIDFSQLTQYAAGSTITNTSDGHASGNLASVSIDNQGRIIGSYTNDVQQIEGQVAVAQFTNAAGLTKKGNSLYQESNNSGTLTVGDNTTLGVTLTTSALEMSNVDVATEFSNMIITQRGFQSNSKIITVSDEMLETLINMKR